MSLAEPLSVTFEVVQRESRPSARGLGATVVPDGSRGVSVGPNLSRIRGGPAAGAGDERIGFAGVHHDAPRTRGGSPDRTTRIQLSRTIG